MSSQGGRCQGHVTLEWQLTSISWKSFSGAAPPVLVRVGTPAPVWYHSFGFIWLLPQLTLVCSAYWFMHFLTQSSRMWCDLMMISTCTGNARDISYARNWHGACWGSCGGHGQGQHLLVKDCKSPTYFPRSSNQWGFVHTSDTICTSIMARVNT